MRKAVLFVAVFALLLPAAASAAKHSGLADPANLVIQNLSSDGNGAATIDVEFDNTTGEITRLLWTVNSGTMIVTVTNPPNPDIVRTLTTSGSLTVPAGKYFLTAYKGTWVWTGSISISESWSPQ